MTALQGAVADHKQRLDVAHMLLRKIRDELNGVAPEDPLDLDAISFFLDEATSRVESVHATIGEAGDGFSTAASFVNGVIFSREHAPKRKAVRR